MPPATFIDANVPIYAAGREHPCREPCIRVLAAVNENPDGFVTDAEVFQEIMHHYRRTQRWDAGQAVVESFATMMRGRVSPVAIDDVLAAGRLATEHQDLITRDLLHLAVMRRLGVTRIVTADADFGRVPGVIRLDPADFGELEPA
ncbi:MAG: type II toxin-antitoxin system VapC family toxin [Dehalococcoidia bacterium]|nr:type II toxin-antitoxin system VapC family toxin [Dehalococcoidia bacterium]